MTEFSQRETCERCGSECVVSGEHDPKHPGYSPFSIACPRCGAAIKASAAGVVTVASLRTVTTGHP